MPGPLPDVPPVASHEPVPFWRGVRQSLRGEEHDYTSLPLNRAELLLAVPMVFADVAGRATTWQSRNRP
jgi:hypothetical protein